MSRLPQMATSSSLLLGVLENIDISKIQINNNVQVHLNLELIEDLRSSIQQKGLLQPIVVRIKEEKDYEIVAGNRRYIACRSIGWRKIMCHIVELDDKEAFEVSLIENLQRRNLSPIEEARAFKAYICDYGWGGLTDLADRIGKSVSFISKAIKLLDLPPDVLQSIEKHEINKSIASELCFVNDKRKQHQLANLIREKNLSFRTARKLINRDNVSGDSNGFDFMSSYRSCLTATERSVRTFDKSIIALKIALKKIAAFIESIDEDDWLTFELMMQHKSMLHTQIDLLIKNKRKIVSSCLASKL
jgi:ParB family transcriptional regulator, chromosome partitioning protein